MGGIEGRFELLGPEQGWYKRGPLRDSPLDPTQEKKENNSWRTLAYLRTS